MGTTVWKPVKGFEGMYEVNQVGTVRSRKTGHCRPLKTKHNNLAGYDFLILFGNSGAKTKTIHRIVAEAFLPNPDGLPCVNHKNEVKTDNRVENLEWCTFAYNSSYSSYKRRKKIAAFTPDGVKVATFESVDFAAMFLGVCKASVSQAVNGRCSSCGGFILKFEEGGN